jgi:hypothetical protein
MMYEIINGLQAFAYRVLILGIFLASWAINTDSNFYFQLDGWLGGNGDGDAPLALFCYLIILALAILGYSRMYLKIRTKPLIGRDVLTNIQQVNLKSSAHRTSNRINLLKIYSAKILIFSILISVAFIIASLFSYNTPFLGTFFNSDNVVTVWVFLRLLVLYFSILALASQTVFDISKLPHTVKSKQG